MSKDYIWYLTDLANIPKNGYKVFTTFSCGGGSSMGYKLGGYEVLGNCEIDPAINAMYVKNHHPKYNYLMGVQDFYKQENIPEDLFDIDVLDGSPPCFGMGTPVKTLEGYKPIEKVCVGDLVLTHKGRYRRVNAVMSKFADNVCELKFQGSLPIVTTRNHPFYAREMKRVGHIQRREFGDPQWKAAGELEIDKNNSNMTRKQDYVAMPVNKEAKIPDWNGVVTEHVIYGRAVVGKERHDLDMTSPDFWRFVGRYLGDGWRRKDRKAVLICDSKDKETELREVIESAGLHGICAMQRTSCRFEILSAELWTFLEQFGNGAEGKRIPEFVLDLPVDLLSAFVKGYVSSDGYREKRSGKLAISSVSLDLILGMQAVIAKVYRQPATITTKDNSGSVIEGRKVNCHQAYGLKYFEKERKQQHFVADEDYLWVPFRSCVDAEPQEVFNLSVDEDESYTVFNIAVHNCSTFSMAGGREKYWGKEKHFREGQAKQVLDDLFFEYLNVAEKLHPKVCVAENVKGLIAGNAKGYVNLVFKRFKEIGYDTQLFLLNSATMGVPQKRERVFFIARRTDLGLPPVKMIFKEKPIVYGEFADTSYKPLNQNTMEYKRWLKRSPLDETIGDTVKRTENGKISGFTSPYLKKDRVPSTLTAGGGMVRFDVPGRPSDKDVITIQSFPQDYDFNGNDPTYVCGMSVPPLMMRGVAREVQRQLLDKIGK